MILCAALVGLGLSLTACGENTANKADQAATNNQLDQYKKAGQDVPFFPWSQYRQTAIDVETAQANGMTTTSFFFNQGVENPIFVCPSIGFPLPSTAQLSNPLQVEWGANGAASSVGMMEPNGVYTGESTATYVVCVAPNGTKYVKYWEGFVDSMGGPAHWDKALQQIVLDGDPTVTATTQPK